MAGLAGWLDGFHGSYQDTTSGGTPYGDLAGRPNVIVDGSPAEGTVLCLSHWPGIPTPPEVRAWGEQIIAMRRAGRPEEVAAAIVFLASPPASYITGHTLAVDGGWTMA